MKSFIAKLIEVSCILISLIAFPNLSFAQTEIEVPDTISSLAINTATNKLYGLSPFDKRYLEIDLDNNKFLNSYNYADDSESLFFSSLNKKLIVDSANNKLFILDSGINIVDSSINKLIKNIPLECSDFEVSSSKNKLWLLDSMVLKIVNDFNQDFTEPFDIKVVKVGESPSRLILNESQNQLLILDKEKVLIFDIETNKVTSEISIGSGVIKIVLDSLQNKMYALTLTGDILIVDLVTKTITDRINLNNQIKFFYPTSLLINKTQKQLYVTSASLEKFVVISATTNKIVDVLLPSLDDFKRSISFKKQTSNTLNSHELSSYDSAIVNPNSGKVYLVQLGKILILTIPMTPSQRYLSLFKEYLNDVREVINNITEKSNSPINIKLKFLLSQKYNSFIDLLNGGESVCSTNFETNLGSVFDPPSKEFGKCCVFRKLREVGRDTTIKEFHETSKCRDCMLGLSLIEYTGLKLNLLIPGDIDLDNDGIIDVCQIKNKDFKKL